MDATREGRERRLYLRALRAGPDDSKATSESSSRKTKAGNWAGQSKTPVTPLCSDHIYSLRLSHRQLILSLVCVSAYVTGYGGTALDTSKPLSFLGSPTTRPLVTPVVPVLFPFAAYASPVKHIPLGIICSSYAPHSLRQPCQLKPHVMTGHDYWLALTLASRLHIPTPYSVKRVWLGSAQPPS